MNLVKNRSIYHLFKNIEYKYKNKILLTFNQDINMKIYLLNT